MQKKQKEKEQDEREENESVDNEDESGLLGLILNEANYKSGISQSIHVNSFLYFVNFINFGTVERHKAIIAQHRLHVFRRLMQKARTKNIDSTIQLITEIDESDHVRSCSQPY